MIDLTGLLARARAAHRDLMAETGRILRPGPDVYDPDTGQTSTPSTQLYVGAARVKPVAQSSGQDSEAGERAVVLREYQISLPWDAEAADRPRPGDQFLVDTSPDPRMAGLVLHITGAQYNATASAWRLGAREWT
ncbi:DUF6093 family protein [Streptomyces sp. CB03911]|uniref:DUF6093 family protein n=1 Tax=Streptomyces sp. CB03911 TaxID=1804758 RepID=UPI0009402478|nr:DUF6093 family protein [Streptomyces sp. CB03911]OKI22207.1 hypothetical protein A6A07_34600 [Streptomyces sp. CB03911]